VSELIQRVLVGAILIVVALAELWAGGTAFWVLVVIAGLLMTGEYADLVDSRQHRRLAQFAMCVPLAIMAPLAAGPGFLGLGLVFGVSVFLGGATRNTRLAVGALYVGLPILALLWLRGQDNGLLLAFWALGLVWATDIGAYFAGRAIGGPKIAPSISPNKTWAGLMGGVVAALLLGWVLMRFAGLPAKLAMLSPVLAVAAQVGDFYESWLKRRAGVKDSGRLLPGHGGVLDRLDGVVTSAPLAALFVLQGAAA
jgi:phosphatidate cytidylyltransferase